MAYIDGLRNIPEAMRRYNQWMLTDKNKAPLAYDWGEQRVYQGSKNRPDQWLSFGDAKYLAEELGLFIGFCPTKNDPFTIIDLDHKDGKVYDADAESIKNGLFAHAAATTYVETSLSGMGAHIVVEGKLEHDFNSQSAGIECYGNHGFVVMTGNLASATNSITNQQNSLEWLRERYASEARDPNGVNVDAELLARIQAPYSHEEQERINAVWRSILNAKNGARYQKFADGGDLNEAGQDRSQNDFDLLQRIYSALRNAPDRDLATIRMYFTTERSREYLLKQKRDPLQYLLRHSLPHIKAIVQREESGLTWAENMAVANDPTRMMAALPAQGSVGLAAPANAGFAPGVMIPYDFEFRKASEVLNDAPPEWAVDDVFMTQSVNAIYGWSGVGKSFVAIDMMMAVAQGQRWFGRVTKQMPVSYLALEGGEGISQRIAAWQKGTRRSLPTNVDIYKGRFDLMNDAQVDALIENRKRAGSLGGMIVIDTLSKATMSVNENDNGEMSHVVLNAERIKTALNACVVLVHHSTKPNKETGIAGGMRGAGALQAGIDGVIEVCRRAARTEKGVGGDDIHIPESRFIVAEKVKEAADATRYEFELNVIPLGNVKRPDGSDKMLTSCFIKWLDEPQIDEVTGEVVNGSAPPLVHGQNMGVMRDKGPTWKPGETPNRALNSRPRSKKQAAENQAAQYNIGAILGDALAIGVSKVNGANRGKFGAPPDKHPTPREELFTIITDLINPTDVDSEWKTAVRNALNYGVNSGRLGRSTENGKQYFWLM